MAIESAIPDSNGFILDEEPMRLPEGAWAKSKRRMLRYQGRVIFGLSQGPFRPYLFPVYTPRGFAVTSESPADHPHHNSIWIGSDRVQCQVPGAQGRIEEYTYNFYVNETFQGRAAGAIRATATAGESRGPDRYRIEQTLEWRGPPEWGAPEGRVIARERRTIDVAPGGTHHVIDIRCALHAAQWDLVLGPTRHAFFNVRAAETMSVAGGGILLDANGRDDAQSIAGANPDWVDLTGPVGGGHEAGITVMPHPECGPPGWFVSDWGVMTVGPFRDRKIRIAAGDSAAFKFRVVIRDIGAAATDLAALYRAYVEEGRHPPTETGIKP